VAKTRQRPARPTQLAPGDKLWSFVGLARLYSWALVGVSIALIGISIALEATSEDGFSWRYVAVLLGMSGISGLIFFPLLRVWLRKGGLPSSRLPDATAAEGPRRLEATPGDWRRWGTLTVVVLLVSSTFMTLFLVAVLGRGGTAEGVVIGVLLAWGLATLEDSRRITRAEAEEGRRYFTAARRPAGAGNRLVWVPAARARDREPAAA
jgi:hypothetical protein